MSKFKVTSEAIVSNAYSESDAEYQITQALENAGFEVIQIVDTESVSGAYLVEATVTFRVDLRIEEAEDEDDASEQARNLLGDAYLSGLGSECEDSYVDDTDVLDCEEVED